MKRFGQTVCCLLFIGSARALGDAQEDDRSIDQVLSVAAQVPAQGTVRLRAGGLASGADARLSGVASTSLLVSLGGRLAAGVLTQWNIGESLAVMAELRWQMLSQRAGAPLDLAAAVRIRSVGHEGVGGAVEGLVAIGRTFGVLELVLNTSLAAGFAGREDVDLEAAASAALRVTRVLRVGVSARGHGELVDELKTEEDEGRPVGLMVGPSVGVRHELFEVQLLVGWSMPRGQAAPGPVAALTGSVDL